MNNKSQQTIRVILLLSITAFLTAMYSCRVLHEIHDASIARISLKATLLAAAISAGFLSSVNAARGMIHGKFTLNDVWPIVLSSIAIFGVKFFLPV